MTYAKTIEGLEQVVRNLAAVFPSFKYTQFNDGECRYAPDSINTQGCIIGAAIRILIPDFDFEPWEGEGAYHVIPAALEISLDQTSELWFDCVQEKQDGNKSWGEAVRLADSDRVARFGPK